MRVPTSKAELECYILPHAEEGEQNYRGLPLYVRSRRPL